jgi:hypothetical protein
MEKKISRLAKRDEQMLLRCKTLLSPMSQMGQLRPYRRAYVMSAPPLHRTSKRTFLIVCFVPDSDIERDGIGVETSGVRSLQLSGRLYQRVGMGTV